MNTTSNNTNTIYIYIYIYTYTHTCVYTYIGDVAFEDAGFENDSLLTLKNWRCGDFTPKADMGEVVFKQLVG